MEIIATAKRRIQFKITNNNYLFEPSSWRTLTTMYRVGRTGNFTFLYSMSFGGEQLQPNLLVAIDDDEL
jgi:hypothetical protein